jgi:hypothetical protein
MRKLVLTISIFLSTLICFAQQKVLTSVKASSAPVIDGKIDEPEWEKAAVANDFIQFFPQPFATPTVRTEVRILYDNDAIYVAARLYDNPTLVRRQLTSRDGEQQADVDYFSVFFDTYNDQQNGFQFLVTSANVQTDSRLGGQDNASGGSYGERSWDAVWQSRTAMTGDGWVAEMRIPYLSLRFSRKEVQTWGLQFARFLRRNSETNFWNPVDPKVSGFVNQFGKFDELRDIQPPLRLSLSPYLSGGVRVSPDNNNNTEWLRSGGMDVKYGINESFTIDATIIPDFGQVVSDNVVNNLTPYEVQFQENRPFFTEGTELFDKSNLFYSRRVGATPIDYNVVRSFADANAMYSIIKNPAPTQLYNAIKFSGRTEKKLGIGVFNAVTAPMRAELRNNITKTDSIIETSPLTNYNIIVLDQAFRGRSHVTFTNTNVLRNGNLRDANVSAVDFSLYNKNNTYAVTGSTRYSKVFGLTPYNMISSSPYSFISGLDTTRINGRKYARPYDGFYSSLRIGKVSGKIQYSATANITSHAYDINDLGYLAYPNEVMYRAVVSYNQFEPHGIFLNSSYRFQAQSNWLYRPYLPSFLELAASGNWLFRNMWEMNLMLGSRPTTINDYFEMRKPGRQVNRPWYAFAFLDGSTDIRKPWYVEYDLSFAEGAIANNPYHHVNLLFRYRFSNKFSLQIERTQLTDRNQIGYVGQEANGEPIGGFRDFKEISSILSGTYNFTPRINFTARARHYWSKVEYNSFFHTDNDGEYIFVPHNEDEDFNFNVFNLDAFFTWDFRPGSRVIAGWKNWLGQESQASVDPLKYKRYFSNLGQTLALPHGNEFTLRLIYFLDYNQLRR